MPARSVARTRNVCAPLARPDGICGLVHVAYAAVSSWHSKVTLVSSEEKYVSRIRRTSSAGMAILLSNQ
ncbi:hypothetical protein D3C83_67580 [compost metagenome]